MDIQARPLSILAILLLTACGSAASSAGARSPEDAPEPVTLASIPPESPLPESPPPETSPPETPAPPEKTRAEGEPRFGLSKEEAINTCLALGQQKYLAKLRCPDGEAPQFRRRGSVGARNKRTTEPTRDDLVRHLDPSKALEPGEIDYHVIDLYEVTCSDKAHEIYMDLYHCADPPPNKPPPGFTIAPKP